MLTVYFDSNFYVWLRKADEATACDTIESLNSLGVRGVISRSLIEELLAFRGSDDKCFQLHHRLQRLRGGFLGLYEGASWDFLLGRQSERELAANIIRDVSKVAVLAEAHGAIADRLPGRDGRLLPAELRALEMSLGPEIAREALRVQSLPEEQRWASGAANRESCLNLLNGLMPLMESLFPGEPPFAELGQLLGEVQEAERPEDAAAVAERMMELLGPWAESMRVRHAARASATRTDNRVLDVAAGFASDATAERLGHTFRDAHHIAEFLDNLECIQLLQVDGVRHGEIQRDLQHPVVLMGARGRVFTASNLGDVVTAIRQAQAG